MRSAVELAVWIATMTGPGVDPKRSAALANGADLERLAVEEDELDGSPLARETFARWLAELRADGWLAWDFDVWPTDSGEPRLHEFTQLHAQRCHRIRLTPEGWRAIPALTASTTSDATASYAEPDDRDVFISHAREDKDAVARPLAVELHHRGWTVWFDDFELRLGDGLRQTIDKGLARSRYGVVVLSPAFFAKQWPQRELDGLVAREMQSGGKVVLPVWHGVDAEYVARFSPPLADKLAASSQLGVSGLADEIERVLVGGEALHGLPTAPTPPTSTVPIANPALDAIMAQNEPSLREVLRLESAAYSRAVDGLIADREEEQPTPDDAGDLGRRLLPTVERYATQLLPLVEHRTSLLEAELRTVARRMQRPVKSGYAFWPDVRKWALWWLTHVLGAYASRRDAFDSMRVLLVTRYSDRLGRSVALSDNSLGAATMLGEALAPRAPEGRRWAAPVWEHLAHSVNESKPLRAGWPELYEPDADSKPSLGEWSFIQGLGLGLLGEDTIGYWSLVPSVVDVARRLHNDDTLRADLARRTFGISIDDLDARAGDALSRSRPIAPFGDTEAVDVLLSGSA